MKEKSIDIHAPVLCGTDLLTLKNGEVLPIGFTNNIFQGMLPNINREEIEYLRMN